MSLVDSNSVFSAQEARNRAADIRRRLRNPPGGRVSTELEIVCTAQIRRDERARLALEYEEIEAKRDFERRQAMQRAIEAAAELQRLTVPIVRAEEDDEAPPKLPKISEIQKLVAARYRVTVNDLLSHRRTADVVLPRQVAMYLAKTLTLRSFPEIGRRFGGRDHTTVLHGVRKIANLVESFPQLAAEVQEMAEILGGHNETSKAPAVAVQDGPFCPSP